MAYAAAVSLMQILEKLLHYKQLPNSCPESQIQSLHEKLLHLQSLLKKKNLVPNSSTSSVHDMETQIIDAMCEAENFIESHILNHLLPSSGGEEIFSEKMIKVWQQFDSIEEATLKIEDFGRVREHQRTRPSQSQPFVLSRFLEGKKQLVGREDILMKLKYQLTGAPLRLEIISVVGMMGIGKTTLVHEVYDDPSTAKVFSYKAWVKIGPTYNLREILLCLLRSMELDLCPDFEDGQLSGHLHEFLKGRKYLIVLDDLYCDNKMWDGLKKVFPDDQNESRIIVTTRQMRVAHTTSTREVHQVRFLDDDESWDLLRYAAIGEESCPFELVKIGKTIAQNCQGLPLKIVVLGSLLSHMKPDAEMWSTIADNRKIQNSEMLRVTQTLDHEQLPHDIKACFLYMVAFPLYQQIPAWKPLKLWVAEGFVEPKQNKTFEDVAAECLEDLAGRNLVMVHRSNSTRRIKTCSIHSAIWPLYDRAATEHKISCSIENYMDNANPNCRRFSIHKNILFSIEDVNKSIASVSTTHALLCTGPYHPYPLRVILSFRLLRVLDALSVRFYKFPVEVLKLVLLRFLALTLNTAELPASVSKLIELQFLIVHRHSSIKSCGAPCFLPMEIWNMTELRHLQVMGSDLPAPLDHMTTCLPNLLTLSDVSSLSCRNEVLRRIPNLQKLGIRTELAWDAAEAPLHMFDHLDHLHRLETLKYVVMNPVPGNEVAVLPYPAFPCCLKKITLSGCGFPWEYMRFIGMLPNLEALKLRCNAFRGSEWEMNEGEFCSLRFLHLEDLDIRHWIADETSLPRLERLAIHHCYKLHQIPLDFGYLSTLETIELVDCSPSAVESATEILEEQKDLGNEWLQIRIRSAWTDHKLKKR